MFTSCTSLYFALISLILPFPLIRRRLIVFCGKRSLDGAYYIIFSIFRHICSDWWKLNEWCAIASNFNERDYYIHERHVHIFAPSSYQAKSMSETEWWPHEPPTKWVNWISQILSWMTVFPLFLPVYVKTKALMKHLKSVRPRQSPLKRTDPDIISMVMIIVSWNVQWDTTSSF